MRKLLFCVIASIVVVGLGMDVLEACGAKFLVASRAARLQRIQVAANPATILLYLSLAQAEETSTADAAEGDNAFQELLVKVGHKVQTATGMDEFRRAARTGDFDLVLMELETARELQAEVGSLAPEATLLPVVEFGSRAVKSRAKAEFGNVLNTPTTVDRILATIDESLSQ